MANVKISALPAADALTGAELVPAVQSGVTKRTTSQDIANLASGAFVLKAGDTMTGALLFSADNTIDIGASGATRARRGYFGTSVVAPSFVFNALGSVTAPSNGVFSLLDTAGTSFGRLQFGGTTSAFPALKRSSAALHARLADDSNYADFFCNNLTIQGTFSAASFEASAAGTFGWAGRSDITSRADGFIDLLNAAGTGFTQLGFGGVTSQPAIRALIGGSSHGFSFNRADNTEYVAVTAQGFIARLASGESGQFALYQKLTISSPSDGSMMLTDGAGTSLQRVMLGGSTSSFPAIKRSGATLQFRLADDSAYCGTVASYFSVSPQQTGWAISNVTTDKTYDANATTVEELADVLGTLIVRLQAAFPGLIDA